MYLCTSPHHDGGACGGCFNCVPKEDVLRGVRVAYMVQANGAEVDLDGSMLHFLGDAHPRIEGRTMCMWDDILV